MINSKNNISIIDRTTREPASPPFLPHMGKLNVRTASQPDIFRLTGTGRTTTCVQTTYPKRLDFVHDRVVEECKIRKGKVRILDIGIGAGNRLAPGVIVRELALKLVEMPNVEIFGLDIDLSEIRQRTENDRDDFSATNLPFVLPNLKYIEADATQTLSVEPDSTDIVLCFNMLIHLNYADKKKVFEQVYKALRVGGRFFFNFNFMSKTFLVLEKTEETVSETSATGFALPLSWLDLLSVHHKDGREQHTIQPKMLPHKSIRNSTTPLILNFPAQLIIESNKRIFSNREAECRLISLRNVLR